MKEKGVDGVTMNLITYLAVGLYRDNHNMLLCYKQNKHCIAVNIHLIVLSFHLHLYDGGYIVLAIQSPALDIQSSAPIVFGSRPLKIVIWLKRNFFALLKF